jgi:hypothetical protein
MAGWGHGPPCRLRSGAAGLLQKAAVPTASRGGRVGPRAASRAAARIGRSRASSCRHATKLLWVLHASTVNRMSYDESETEYHLTPRGWTTGERPTDCAETWLRSTSQQSGWSKDYIKWRPLWAAPTMSRVDRDALRRRHQEFMGRPGRWDNTITTIGEPL